MLGILVCLIILAAVGLPWWYRLCENKERLAEMQFEHERHIAELEMCYGTEQHFLEIEDDEEHMASITPGMPSLTDEEQTEAKRELADETA